MVSPRWVGEPRREDLIEKGGPSTITCRIGRGEIDWHIVGSAGRVLEPGLPVDSRSLERPPASGRRVGAWRGTCLVQSEVSYEAVHRLPMADRPPEDAPVRGVRYPRVPHRYVESAPRLAGQSCQSTNECASRLRRDRRPPHGHTGTTRCLRRPLHGAVSHPPTENETAAVIGIYGSTTNQMTLRLGATGNRTLISGWPPTTQALLPRRRTRTRNSNISTQGRVCLPLGSSSSVRPRPCPEECIQSPQCLNAQSHHSALTACVGRPPLPAVPPLGKGPGSSESLPECPGRSSA